MPNETLPAVAAEWTSTPPSEPGWYWADACGGDGYLLAVECSLCCGFVELWVGGDPANRVPIGAEWLWWPVPIEPPPVRKEPDHG